MNLASQEPTLTPLWRMDLCFDLLTIFYLFNLTFVFKVLYSYPIVGTCLVQIGTAEAKTHIKECQTNRVNRCGSSGRRISTAKIKCGKVIRFFMHLSVLSVIELVDKRMICLHFLPLLCELEHVQGWPREDDWICSVKLRVTTKEIVYKGPIYFLYFLCKKACLCISVLKMSVLFETIFTLFMLEFEN